MHNLREVGQGLRLYQFENDGWLPGAHVAADGERPESINAVWFVPLCRSFLDPSALTCPSDPFRYRMLQARDRLTDPAVADYPSYGISSLALYGRGGTLADVDRRMPTRPLDTILVADLGPDNRPAEQPVEHKRPEPGKPTMTVTATVSLSSANAGPQRNGSLLSWDDGYDPLAFDTPPTWLTVRHADGVNMLTLAGGVRSARTANLLRRPVLRYYPDCEAGGCSLCIARQIDQVYHYSFAQDRLYWWTGPVQTD